MTSPWAGLQVGDDILPEAFFAPGWHSDFSKELDGGVNAGGILGTTPGYDGDPFNFNYNTDGQFKVGSHLQFHQNYATGYQYPHASEQLNLEPHHYVHFHGRDAADANPDPMSFFEKRNGHLVMKARPVTEEEKVWARLKGNSIDEDANSATYDWWAANGGVPSEWRPDSETGAGAAPVYFRSMPADYASTMLSTYNRRSMSFGRSMARVIVPFGAKITGEIEDLRNIQAWFAAVWDLEDVPPMCDINGRQHDLDTHTPGNINAGDVLSEFDKFENFGSNAEMEVTSHLYELGIRGTSGNGGGLIDLRQGRTVQTDHTPPHLQGQLMRNVAIEIGMDRFPAYGNEPGVLVYHINNKIVAIKLMPWYLSDPKILYQKHPFRTYTPVLKADFTPARLGSQVYDDGNPAYTHFCQIFNTAMSAQFVRRLARDRLLEGTVPDFNENEEFTIEYTRMSPLIDENPDTRPLIDYTVGDFGGSSSDQQSIVINSYPPNSGVAVDDTGTPDNPNRFAGLRFKPEEVHLKWVNAGYTLFNVYRDGVKQNIVPIEANSWVFEDFTIGSSGTTFELRGITGDTEVPLGPLYLSPDETQPVFDPDGSFIGVNDSTDDSNILARTGVVEPAISYSEVLKRPNGGSVLILTGRHRS